MRIRFVAGAAGHLGMTSCQRKVRGVVIEPIRTPMLRWTVASRAIDGRIARWMELTVMNVIMAIDATGGEVVEGLACLHSPMTCLAIGRSMPPLQGPIGLVVIERNRHPLRCVVTIRAIRGPCRGQRLRVHVVMATCTGFVGQTEIPLVLLRWFVAGKTRRGQMRAIQRVIRCIVLCKTKPRP